MFGGSTSSEDSVESDTFYHKSAFRVSVCLQQYYKDFRSRCYILITRKRPVRWLEKRIQKIFEISGKFCLCLNGHLLPSSEPLALLNPEDSIDVIPITHKNDVNQHDRDKSRCKDNKMTSPLELQYIQTQKEKKCSTTSNGKSDKDQNLQPFVRTHVDEDNVNSGLLVEQPSYSTTLEDIQVKNDGLDCTNENCNTTESLFLMKRKALAILDSTESEEKKVKEWLSDPPRRTRHRVRRRRRCVPELEKNVSENQDEEVSSEVPQNEASPLQSTVQSQIDALFEKMETETEKYNSPLFLEVARNEVVHPRKPRVIYSLDE